MKMRVVLKEISALQRFSIRRGALLPTYTEQMQADIFLTWRILFGIYFYTAETVILANPFQSLSLENYKEC